MRSWQRVKSGSPSEHWEFDSRGRGAVADEEEL